MSGIEVPPGIILFEDPPIHDLHRRLLSRVFTPRRMEAIEPLTRQYCVRASIRSSARDGSTSSRDLGAQIPMRTIGYLLGIPEQNQETIRDTTEHALTLKEGEFSGAARGPVREQPPVVRRVHRLAGRPPVRRPDDPTAQRGAGGGRRVSPADPHRGAHVHQHGRRCGQRDDDAADRVRRTTPRRTPRPAARIGGRPLADPRRDRGGAALRGAVTGAGTLRRPRRRVPRADDPEGLDHAAAQRFGQPGRAPLPGRRPLRHPPQSVRI